MSDQQARSRDRERTRARILHAAERLFARHGFDGTSLDRIARDVGVDKALIPYYFKNKAGLYRAIIAENIRIVRTRMEERLAADVSAEEAMRIYIRALAETMSERADFGSMLIREHISTAFMKDQDSAIELLGFFRITQDILGRGLREKAFREVDAHLFHLNLVGAVIFFISTERFRRTATVKEPGLVLRPSLDTFIEHTSSLFLDGLLTDHS